MKKMLSALLAAASCAGIAQAQSGGTTAGPILTLDQAVQAAGGIAPAGEIATAEIDAARAGREIAGLRPNPVLQVQVENIAGSGPYGRLRSAESTFGVAMPIELGGKRGARVAVATARLSRAELQAAIAAADLRLQVTRLYVEAVAAERRMATAREQAQIAGEALKAASIRVRSGRASPIEQQRADLARIEAEANVGRQTRLSEAARINLARRIGRSVDGPLDADLLERLPQPGPIQSRPQGTATTLATIAADSDLAVADAGVRLARAEVVPDLTVGPALRRLEATNDTAAVFSVSIPIRVFNSGRATIAQARADRSRAEAQRRLTLFDTAQAITDAGVEAENAAITARAAAGPALAAAREAARIARIGYREGKFGQLDLLDAERSLAETRVAAIDAQARYQIARAQLERLIVPAPSSTPFEDIDR